MIPAPTRQLEALIDEVCKAEGTEGSQARVSTTTKPWLRCLSVL